MGKAEGMKKRSFQIPGDETGETGVSGGLERQMTKRWGPGPAI